jgi:hypothetical protein
MNYDSSFTDDSFYGLNIEPLSNDTVKEIISYLQTCHYLILYCIGYINNMIY